MPDSVKMPPASPLQLNISAEVGKRFVPFLRTNIRRAFKLAAKSSRRPALRSLSLVLVNDRRMSQLHEQFMNLSGPTDVLSFPLELDAKGRTTDGEVYVCVPEALRQSSRRKIPCRLELLLYATHGMLHLLGYDDRTDRDFARIHQMEDAILTRLGFGPVFAPEHREAPSR
jgi:probable rRNA maturation factor